MPDPIIPPEDPEDATAADEYYLSTLPPGRLEYYERAARVRAYAESPAAGPRLTRAYNELARRRQGGRPNGPLAPEPPGKIVPPPAALSAAAGILY